MGHFGRPAITRAWLILVFPACVLSYMGQGALVLDDPTSNISSPFFLLVPEWGRLPMALLATAADGDRLAGRHQRRILGRLEGRATRVLRGCGSGTRQRKRSGR
jgi:hypothetical protein